MSQLNRPSWCERAAALTMLVLSVTPIRSTGALDRLILRLRMMMFFCLLILKPEPVRPPFEPPWMLWTQGGRGEADGQHGPSGQDAGSGSRHSRDVGSDVDDGAVALDDAVDGDDSRSRAGTGGAESGERGDDGGCKIANARRSRWSTLR